jgi:hypothetical protein
MSIGLFVERDFVCVVSIIGIGIIGMAERMVRTKWCGKRCPSYLDGSRSEKFDLIIPFAFKHTSITSNRTMCRFSSNITPIIYACK